MVNVKYTIEVSVNLWDDAKIYAIGLAGAELLNRIKSSESLTHTGAGRAELGVTLQVVKTEVK